MKYRCNYYDLLRGIDYHNGGEWRWECEQCPQAPTRYVCVDQADGLHHGVTHWVNLCDEHDQMVRELAGWRSSEPKQVFA